MAPAQGLEPQLAPYAMHEIDSAGRSVPEEVHPYRGCYQRDRDRIIHSSAFRRLSYKTQVFTGELGDYHRTRLTHTLEVVSIARTVARVLRLNEDLVEALALAHDIGHPPFGHAGEGVLNERLAGHGGFNHNRQALRIVERLERRYNDRPGLNLTAEVLDGQRLRGDKPARDQDCLAPNSFPDAAACAPLLEVQVVDASDRIAYDSHDTDDALQLGLITLEDLADEPLWRRAIDSVQRHHVALESADLRRAAVHSLLNLLVLDLIEVSQRQITERGIDSVSAVRKAGLIICPSKEITIQQLSLEKFLFEKVYRHPVVLRQRGEATTALGALFDKILDHKSKLPAEHHVTAEQESPQRAVADYVSSLTDRAVLEGYRKEHVASPKAIDAARDG